MSVTPRRPDASDLSEEGIAELYQLAGFDIRQAVGDTPGSIVWLTTPAQGPHRPTTLFRALAEAPETPGQLLEELETARVAAGADRALGILLRGSTPVTDASAPAPRPSSLVAFRRWLLNISGITGYVRELAERHSEVSCVVDVDPAIVVHVIGHGLRDVLHCIVENAFHAALTGSRAPSARVAARALGGTVIIDVEDSGDGIASDERQRIFDPFRTTKKGGTGKLRGTGLGLLIARKHAHALGGRVELLSERTWTTFSVELIGKRRSE